MTERTTHSRRHQPSDHITLNTNTPTRVPHTTLQQTFSPDITDRCLTHCTSKHCGQYNYKTRTIRPPTHPHHNQNKTHLQTTTIQTHLHELQESRLDNTHKRHRSCFLRHTHTHTANTIFTNVILQADRHNLPKGKILENNKLLLSSAHNNKINTQKTTSVIETHMTSV